MANEFVVRNGLIVSESAYVLGNLNITGGVVQGEQAFAGGISSRAQGFRVTASANYTHAEGSFTRATSYASHAEGFVTLATELYSHVEGWYATASGVSSHAEGGHTTTTGHSSHAEGTGSRTTGAASHAEGFFTLASSIASHAEGAFTSASGLYSHAEGNITLASGIYSHAEGGHTRATVEDAHAEGTGSTASGVGSHAEGAYTLASGIGAHAEGQSNSASGNYSHAEGQGTVASGLYSHTEGFVTTGSGNYSHAEGDSTSTPGSSAHAEGIRSVASGIGSHAEGYYTVASGLGSHAEGLSTTASGDYQHVAGRFNATSSTALWIVGDGLSNADKKNLVTAFRDHLVISGSQSITGSFNSISSSVNVDFGRLNVTSGSIHMNSGSLGTNIYGTSSWADQLSRGPVVLASSAPAQIPSGGLWWNTNENEMYLQTTSPSGSTWTAVVNQTVPFASSSRTVVSQITPSTFGGTMIISENKLFYLNGTEGNANNNGGFGSTNGSNFPGVLNMRQINFPDESPTALIVSASTYGRSAFALFDNGNLYTWGKNNVGQLGLGDTTDRNFPNFSAGGVIDVFWDPSQYHRSPDLTHFFIKKSDGIYATGYNAYGQLGAGDLVNKTSWTRVYIGNLVRKVWPLGGFTGMSILQANNGIVSVCGYNGQGQLGLSNTTDRRLFFTASFGDGNLSNIIQDVSFGGADAEGPIEQGNIAIHFSGGANSFVATAGANSWGTVGNGTTTGNVSTQITPANMNSGVAKIARAGNVVGSIWVLKTDGTLWNWGYNAHGQLDRGTTTDSGVPTQVETGVLDILYPKGAAYFRGYLAASPIIRKADGYYRCGFNQNGQLADGTTTNRSNIVKMLFPAGIVLTTVGSVGTDIQALTFYAVDTQNRIYAWGHNAQGAIDPTNLNSPITVPVQMSPGALMR